MKKTIVALAAAGFLGGTAATLTPVPAHAVYPLAFWLTAKPDPKFKAQNPYEVKKMKKRSGKKMKKAKRA